MTRTMLADDTWIVNQLMGIKVLEKDLSTAVAGGTTRRTCCVIASPH